MNSNSKKKIIGNPKAVLSSLWIYLSLNYIYCDHLGIMEPDVFKGLFTGHIAEIKVTQGFLIAAAVLLQIPFIMIVLCRILNYKINRIANIIAGILMIILQLGTMGFGSSPSAVYIFYSVIEIACNLFIVWIAWRWVNVEKVNGNQ